MNKVVARFWSSSRLLLTLVGITQSLAGELLSPGRFEPSAQKIPATAPSGEGSATSLPPPSVNLHKLPNFWRAANVGTGPLVAGHLGDSVGGLMWDQFVYQFMAGFGTNGGATINNQAFTWTSNGGALTNSKDSYWFQRYWYLDSNPTHYVQFGAVHFNVPATQYYVCYVVEPGAGSFKVQFSTNADSVFGDVLTVSASSEAIAGAVTNITLPLGSYKMRVVGVSGNVRLINAGRYNPSAPGLTPWSMSEPGWCTTNFTYANSNVVLGILTNMPAPKLLLIEFKDVNLDESTNVFATNFLAFHTLLRRCFPKSDLLFVGTTPTWDKDVSSFGKEDDGVLFQNQFVQNRCAALGEPYWDGYSPFRSFAFATNNGWYADGRHPSRAGSKFIPAGS
jgi:hypothetical protein